MYKDTNDTEDPGSIIWTGNGNSPGSESSSGSVTCFSGDATVQVLGFGITPLEDLHVGDYVLSGGNRFETIYAFAHQNRHKGADLLAIYTSGGHSPLEISSRHMVFLDQSNIPVPADSIKVGDVLRGSDTPRLVTKIDPIRKKGIYAPLTKSGTIVVDGVVASSYTALQKHSLLAQHDYCHMGLSPFRLYCGISQRFCNSYNQEGMPHYVAFSIWLTNLVNAQHVVLQAFYLVLFLLVTGLCTALESKCILVSLSVVSISYFSFRYRFQIRVTSHTITRKGKGSCGEALS